MIGLVPNNVGLVEDLSAYENLDYYGKLYDCTVHQRKKNIEYFLKLLGLWEQRNQRVGEFSAEALRVALTIRRPREE